jgi:hypothetical protein
VYRVARTEIPGQSFRPFDERLGRYLPSNFTIPTQSYRKLPPAGPVTGGLKTTLGQTTGGTMMSWLFLGFAALGGWYFLMGPGKR